MPVSLETARRAPTSPNDVSGAKAREGSAASREQLVRRIGLLLLAVQLLGLLAFSAFEFSRLAEETDMAGDLQAWFLIAHGHLDPHVSVWGGASFLRVHGELIMWLLAPLWWVAPSGLTLLWVQDLAVVAAETVIFWWIVDFAFGRWGGPADTGRPAQRHRAGRAARRDIRPDILSAIGLVLLVGNPWIYWSVAFDYHNEVLGAAFIVFAAFDLARHRRRFWVWIVLTVLCGDVAATYVAGLGASALLAGPAWRRRGLALIGLSAVAAAAVTALGANAGSNLTSFESPAARRATGPGSIAALFASPFEDPGYFFRGLWPDRLNMWAMTAPAGAIGLVSGWGFGVPVLVLTENNLTGPGFSLTAFQNLAVFLFVALGGVMVLQRLMHWRAAVGVLASILVVVSTLGWFVVWFPKTASTWVRVSAAAAATIHRGLDDAPASAEVVAPHAVVGALSARTDVVTLGPVVPIRSRLVYFVTAPDEGIEVDPVPYGIAQTALVADLPAQLVSSGGGAWVFRWTPPKGMTELRLPVTCCTEPAWSLDTTAAGHTVTTGPPRSWRVSAVPGTSGYLLDGDYWPEPVGRYVARVDLSTNALVNVEVWNATTNTLLTRRTVLSTNGRATVVLPVDFRRVVVPPTRFSGAGPFRTDQLPNAISEDQLEIRVWSSGGGSSDVYTVSLRPSTAAKTATG